MLKFRAGLGSLALVAGIATVAPGAHAAPPVTPTAAPVGDDIPDRLETKRRELREEAIKEVIAGRAKVQDRNGSKVVRLGKTPDAEDQYVELAREKTDRIFVVLAEFGDERHPDFPDEDTDPATPGPVTFNGPQHNKIPAPDRSRDNTTVWQANYDRDHYQQLYFGTGAGVESLKTYYEQQSSGRYTVDGEVTDWVKVRYNEARYGRSNGYPCPTQVCGNSSYLVQDAVNQWVADQKAAGRTDAEIKADLATFDQWDRNDFDHDGDFNEPDGYIDHFQIVHAGADQSDGDPQYGEDAIWAHRGRAFNELIDVAGPEDNRAGGTQIADTGFWVSDYTMQPENGGYSVFAHEYAHDLGLPDEYDTAGGANGVNWWTLMAQSRVNAAEDQALGTRAADLGAWDKLQLGWLDYEVVGPGQTRTIDLGPHEYNSAKAQGVVQVLPKKRVTLDFGPPAAGTKQWWSGTDDDYEATLSRQVAIPAEGSTSLQFMARWNIEDCGPDACDYAYVQVNDGSGYKSIPGSIANAAEGNAIDGLQPDYEPATFDLSAYAGKTVTLRFLYRTDLAQQGNSGATMVPGIQLDEIKVLNGTQTVFSDGAESGDNGWTADGFSIVAATRTTDYDTYYVASNRTYTSYDRYLQTGPYNFGFPDRPDFVEHFPYQNGLLISYWDSSHSNNNTSQHPGEGEILPIDANPQALYRLDGNPWASSVQMYDATFGLEKSDSLNLHIPGKGTVSYVRGQAGQPLFDDRRDYWDPVIPRVGVKVPHAGVQFRVQQQSGTSMRIKVGPAPKPAT
jgi:immune inhibitor A